MATGTTVQITMPEMGESVTEGTILEWLKQEGDPVEADEGIVEVSTDKVDAEVPAPASGVLRKILVQPDETVPTGTVLGEIEVNGARPDAGGGQAPRRRTAPPGFPSEGAHGGGAHPRPGRGGGPPPREEVAKGGGPPPPRPPRRVEARRRRGARDGRVGERGDRARVA